MIEKSFAQKWKTTKMEDDQNGRQPKWKTTKMEDDQSKSNTSLYEKCHIGGHIDRSAFFSNTKFLVFRFCDIVFHFC